MANDAASWIDATVVVVPAAVVVVDTTVVVVVVVTVVIISTHTSHAVMFIHYSYSVCIMGIYIFFYFSNTKDNKTFIHLCMGKDGDCV